LAKYAKYANYYRKYSMARLVDGGSLGLDVQNPLTQTSPPLIPAPL